MTLEIAVTANIDDVVIAWRTAGKLDGCLGFAIERLVGDQRPHVLSTQLPFIGDPVPPPGTKEPSSTWPIQRFVWTDHSAPAGSALQYRVRPVFGPPEATILGGDADSSAWNTAVTRATETSPGYALFPNRGIVAAPWIEAQIEGLQAAAGSPKPTGGAVLRTAIAGPTSHVRLDLAGPVLSALKEQFQRATAEQQDIHIALYELSDPELIGLLISAGSRVHLILGNGSFDSKSPDPNHAAAEQLVAAGLEVHRRLVTSGHLAHNKFMVFSGIDGPERVWTGSTNWTPTGLCTQANHAVVVSDIHLAMDYRTYWQRLLDSGSIYPAALVAEDTAATSPPEPSTRSWFTPVKNFVDLADAAALIDGATQGALFLMFRPGDDHTLVDNIKGVHDRGLFVRGIVNDDFLGKNTAPTLEFFNSSAIATHADPEVILPDHLRTAVGNEDPEVGVTGVLIHSKVIVLDPFGDHPVVMTGSHNLGQKASSHNDDNLLIIEHQPGLAAEFAVYIMNVYDHYKWRYELGLRTTPAAAADGTPQPRPWTGLARDDSWQTDDYLAAATRQAGFWFGRQ